KNEGGSFQNCRLQCPAGAPRPAGAPALVVRWIWRRTSASEPKTIAIVTAHVVKNAGGPPVSSAHDPTYELRTCPMRPTATAVPTPVPRISVGYTFAASAYMVVCTAFIRPPVTVNM